MWEIYFSKDSIKKINSFNPELTQNIKVRIKNLQEWLNDNDSLTIDFKKLHGQWKNYYRIKIGKIRVLVLLEYREQKIKIIDIGFRGDIYK